MSFEARVLLLSILFLTGASIGGLFIFPWMVWFYFIYR
jgi:Sec-independent protein secretion pathway component TatC